MTKINSAEFATKLTDAYPGSTRFLVELFGFALPNAAEALATVEQIQLSSKSYPNGQAATIATLDLSEVNFLATRLIALGLDSGRLSLHALTSQLKLPKAEVVALMAPIEMSATGSNYSRTRETLDFTIGWLSAIFGRLFTYDKIVTFELGADGAISFTSSPFRTPQFADLSVVRSTNILNDIGRRLAAQTPDFKNTLSRASSYLSRAVTEPEMSFRFLAYWTALEVLSGKANAIQANLSKHYSNEGGRRYVESDLRLLELSNKRHDLVHFGRFDDLYSYQERLLQAYFWDIVGLKVGISTARFAKGLIATGLVEKELSAKQNGPAEGWRGQMNR